MAYNYIFDPIAADEYLKAFKWYEKRSPPLLTTLFLPYSKLLMQYAWSLTDTATRIRISAN